MKPTEYQTMFNVEDRHWWYVGMKRISLTLLRQLYPQPTALRILDAGCGSGATMQYLGNLGEVTGCDYSPLALGFCRQRGLERLCQATVNSLPFVDGRFDLITSFDVLYHRSIEDYRLPLAEFYRALKPGGRLFLRLPAYNWLRGRHDEVVYTAHRFTAGELRRALAQVGFEVERVTYANMCLFPLALGKRLVERLWPPQDDSSDVKANPAWQDDLLVHFLNGEARWLSRFNLPFGLTVMAVGRKTAV